jgi:predicted amidophosphoribosyltransferase
MRDTGHQARLARAERAENVAGAFALGRPAPGPVVLVDDVVTTGATIRACAAALERGGTRVIAVWAVARAGS